MSEHNTRTDGPGTPRRPRASHAAFLWLAVAVLAVVVLAGRQETTHADSEPKVDIAYLYVTNEGNAAKAWYDGAPSPGVPVQDALNTFAKQGYKVASMTENLRATVDLTAYVILLQRVQEE
jgi:hypothetical protein